jgi:hypothetical protein
MNSQAATVSKNMRLFLRLSRILLLIMAVLPWMIPTTKIGGFLLSIYGVPAYLPIAHQSFGDSFYNFNWLSRSIGIFGSGLCLLPLFFGIVVILNIYKNNSVDKIFSAENASACSQLGILYLLSALLLQPLSQAFFSLSASLDNPVGQHFISFSFEISNLTAIFFSVLLIIMGRIMRIGHQMREEQKLTI